MLGDGLHHRRTAPPGRRRSHRPSAASRATRSRLVRPGLEGPGQLVSHCDLPRHSTCRLSTSLPPRPRVCQPIGCIENSGQVHSGPRRGPDPDDMILGVLVRRRRLGVAGHPVRGVVRVDGPPPRGLTHLAALRAQHRHRHESHPDGVVAPDALLELAVDLAGPEGPPHDDRRERDPGATTRPRGSRSAEQSCPQCDRGHGAANTHHSANFLQMPGRKSTDARNRIARNKSTLTFSLELAARLHDPSCRFSVVIPEGFEARTNTLEALHGIGMAITLVKGTNPRSA